MQKRLELHLNSFHNQNIAIAFQYVSLVQSSTTSLMLDTQCTTLKLLIQITNLMHNFFVLQQYLCYTTILNMFRAASCSSSGGQIVSPQPLVSSPSVNSRTVCRLTVRSQPAYCTAVYRGWRYQRLWWYNLSSWGWAACCSKHVEDRSVT